LTGVQTQPSAEVDCPFASGWRNREGWLVTEGGLVCLDWDEYCTKCRVDDTQDCVFAVAPASKQQLRSEDRHKRRAT